MQIFQVGKTQVHVKAMSGEAVMSVPLAYETARYGVVSEKLAQVPQERMKKLAVEKDPSEEDDEAAVLSGDRREDTNQGRDCVLRFPRTGGALKRTAVQERTAVRGLAWSDRFPATKTAAASQLPRNRRGRSQAGKAQC